MRLPPLLLAHLRNRFVLAWSGIHGVSLHGKHFALDRHGLDLLVEACHGHSSREFHDDPTVQTCWDADRLDLGRVGILPDPDRLGTAPAKRREVIAWTYRWNIGERGRP